MVRSNEHFTHSSCTCRARSPFTEDAVKSEVMAGLALGTVSLAGLFNNAVDSYGYLRLGQHYARDFETSQTKLDLSRLQLSRWGAALGLDANPTQARSRLPALSVSPYEVQEAEAVLHQITELLDDASIASKRFEARNKQAKSTTALNSNDVALHKKISSLVLRRLPKTPIVKEDRVGAVWQEQP